MLQIKTSADLKTKMIEIPYNINGDKYVGIATNDLSKKRKYITEDILNQIVESFNEVYSGGYLIKTKDEFKQRLFSDAYVLLVLKEENQFVLLACVFPVCERRDNTFDGVWHGDFTVEPSNAFRNPRFSGVVSFSTFNDLIAELINMAILYVHEGYEPWGTARVPWSTNILMRVIPESSIVGFPLYHKKCNSIWDAPSTWTSDAMVVGLSSIRKTYTAKTTITEKYKTKSWAQHLLRYLNPYEGEIENELVSDPVELELEDQSAHFRSVIVSASDFETIDSLINDGYRIATIWPSRLYLDGLFRSIVVLQKAFRYDNFPKGEPPEDKWKKHLREWPPTLTKETWDYINKFQLLEMYPEQVRKFFPWVSE